MAKIRLQEVDVKNIKPNPSQPRETPGGFSRRAAPLRQLPLDEYALRRRDRFGEGLLHLPLRAGRARGDRREAGGPREPGEV